MLRSLSFLLLQLSLLLKGVEGNPGRSELKQRRGVSQSVEGGQNLGEFAQGYKVPHAICKGGKLRQAGLLKLLIPPSDSALRANQGELFEGRLVCAHLWTERKCVALCRHQTLCWAHPRNSFINCHTILAGRYWYYLCFRGEKAEAQRGEETGPRSPGGRCRSSLEHRPVCPEVSVVPSLRFYTCCLVLAPLDIWGS